MRSFAVVSATALIVYHSNLCLSTTFFKYFWHSPTANGEGGIWTLAPLLTTCTLSRGVPSTSWVLLQIVDSDNLYNDRRHECLAERVGFEPTRPFGQTVFKTASLWPLRYLSKRACLLYYSFRSLSRGFLNFFIFLCCDVLRSPATLIVYHVHFQMSTSFFYFFYFLFFPVFLDYQNRKSSGLVAFSIDQYFPSNRAPRLPDPPE